MALHAGRTGGRTRPAPAGRTPPRWRAAHRRNSRARRRSARKAVPWTMRVAASAMSQPGSTTAGDLPSSSVTGVRCSAAVRITVRPTAGEASEHDAVEEQGAVKAPGSSSSSPTTATWSSLNASTSGRRRRALVAGVAFGASSPSPGCRGQWQAEGPAPGKMGKFRARSRRPPLGLVGHAGGWFKNNNSAAVGAASSARGGAGRG